VKEKDKVSETVSAWDAAPPTSNEASVGAGAWGTEPAA
jgi:hypothetical protein